MRAPQAPVSPSRAGGADASLVRAMGTWALAAGIVNVTIGGGIFRLPSSVAASLGAAAPLAYLVCALAMVLIVVCFASAGSRVSLTGGVYAYVEVAFGPLAGWVTGALLWVGLTAALAAVTTFLMDSLTALMPWFAGPFRAVMMVLIVASLAMVNVSGVAVASRFNALVTLAKLLPLLLLVAVGAFAIRPENLVVTHAPSAGDVSRASLTLIFAFLGIEAALVPGGEVRDPARTVPRAVFIAIGVVAIAYLSIQVVAQGLLGSALAGQRTPLAEAGAVALGGWGRELILIGSAISMFGYVSGMTLSTPRMLFAFARDGFLPAPLARVHPRFRTPDIAIWTQTIVVLALALSGGFEKLAIIANGAVLLVYVGCVLAAMELRRRDVRADGGGVPFSIPGMAVAPPLALLVIAFMLSTLTRPEWLWMLVAIATALVLYLVRRVRTSAT